MAVVTSTIKSLSAATVTGGGAALLIPKDLTNTFNVGLFVTSGGTAVATSSTVILEVSLDNVTWMPINTVSLNLATATPNLSQGFTVPAGSGWVRANLTVLTGGTAPTVTATIALAVDVPD